MPMPAIAVMANAPQNVTRAVAFTISAPPALAPTATNSASKPNEAMVTTGARLSKGALSTMAKGIAAPIANVAAEFRAAPRRNSCPIPALDSRLDEASAADAHGGGVGFRIADRAYVRSRAMARLAAKNGNSPGGKLLLIPNGH